MTLLRSERSKLVLDFEISPLIFDGDAAAADQEVDAGGTDPEVVEFDPVELVR